MKFMQERRFYVRLCYDMLFFFTTFQLLSKFNAVIGLQRSERSQRTNHG